ncbi:unnamed protein product [Effrenium voratum]|uniref:Uncharacterized protein n=1 Tax=Effrenium voratum TaxID=2562239 RepID=A0AA36IUC0_9DINO|nr:unnamed protein product [Effrenium voratum]
MGVRSCKIGLAASLSRFGRVVSMSAKPFSMGRLLRLLLPALVAAGSVDLDAIEVEAEGEAEAERAEASAPGVALEPADLLMISMVTGKEDDELTLENADEACQSHTQAGDDWHLCLKEEVEDHWAEFMDKSEGAYGFRAWLQQKGFSEGGCIYNGRRSEATKDEPYWACGYPKGKKFNALCCVDMPNVAVRTAGSKNSQNLTQAEATCKAYHTRLCEKSEKVEVKKGAKWAAWGAKGCVFEAAKKLWTCVAEDGQEDKYDALCCKDPNPLQGLWPTSMGDPYVQEDIVDCNNKALTLDGGCEEFNKRLHLCGGQLENRSGYLVHCVVDTSTNTCRPSKVQCLPESCSRACRGVR